MSIDQQTFKLPTFKSSDEVQINVLKWLFSVGEKVTTREFNTLELCNINFCLDNPRNRVAYNSIRKWNKSLAIGEFAWHISGSNDLDFITYYARNWRNFSSDGVHISQSCYGHKIFQRDDTNESQWDRLIKLLKIDKFSRRAVLNLYDSEQSIDYFSKDIACVCTVQFLIRNNKLDAIVNMRSNDVIWGLPYDIYFFSMLQELLSLKLEVELGKYYHNVGSMHIYDRHFQLGKEMINAELKDVKQPIMDDINSLPLFIKYEEKIRTSEIKIEDINSLEISSYWKDLLVNLLEYKAKKQNI